MRGAKHTPPRRLTSSPRCSSCMRRYNPSSCTAMATAATAWCAAAAAGEVSGWLEASVSSGGMSAGRCEWMAAPARGGAGVQGRASGGGTGWLRKSACTAPKTESI